MFLLSRLDFVLNKSIVKMHVVKVLLSRSLLMLFSFFLIACGTFPAAKKDPMTVKTGWYQLPVSYQQHRMQQSYFETRDGKIAYTDTGSGKTLVLLHGVPTSSWLYRKVIPELQKDFRVITVDLLGYGSSDKPKDNGQNYLSTTQARNVINLLNFLDVEAFALGMHDMGGLVAWDILRGQTDRVSDLVVFNTIVRRKGFHHPHIKEGLIAREMTKAYSNQLTSSAVLEMTFSNLGLGGQYSLTEAECHGYVKPMREGSDQALYNFFTGFDESLFAKLEDNSNVFRQFEGRVLVIWGGKDKVLTTEQIPFLQKHLRIPEHNIHIFPENNHFIMEEIPEQIPALIKFLSIVE